MQSSLKVSIIVLNKQRRKVLIHQAASNHTKGAFRMATSDATDSPVEIQLTKGYSAVVDAVDADLCSLNWVALEGWRGVVYAARCTYTEKGRRNELLHRVILSRMLGCPLDTLETVDHVDGNGLNNRRDNLRLATQSQQSANVRRPVTNRSGYKGVSFDQRYNKWRARIKVNQKERWLGYFDTPQAAHQAYCDAAVESFGEFANPGDSRT